MTDAPLVSVVIPTYYRNEALTDAITSALEQTHDPVEVIVVDDSGQRHAEAVVSAFDVTYLAHDHNRGANPARTTGFDHADGEYIQFLDDDDEIHERKVERQLRRFDATTEVGVVYCGLRYERLGPGVVHPDEDCRGDVLHRALQFDMNPCQTGTMLIDAGVLGEIMPLETRAGADDIGMKIRLATRTEFDFVDEVLFSKGSVDGHRASTAAFADELERIITEDHADLYARAPDSVYETAMYRMYRSRGFNILNESRWSSESIRAFASAIDYADDVTANDLACLAVSVFGRPGISAAVGLKRVVMAVRGSR